jgi:hypothetical protein
MEILKSKIMKIKFALGLFILLMGVACDPKPAQDQPGEINSGSDTTAIVTPDSVQTDTLKTDSLPE